MLGYEPGMAFPRCHPILLKFTIHAEASVMVDPRLRGVSEPPLFLFVIRFRLDSGRIQCLDGYWQCCLPKLPRTLEPSNQPRWWYTTTVEVKLQSADDSSSVLQLLHPLLRTRNFSFLVGKVWRWAWIRLHSFVRGIGAHHDLHADF